MKEKLQKEVIKVGTKTVDYEKLEHYEAVSIAVVGILSATIGTIYGSGLF
ncbi:MAG TPA: hypothetical protein PK263_02325 [bacterium]|nr:hypothetical protein [bacterium]